MCQKANACSQCKGDGVAYSPSLSSVRSASFIGICSCVKRKMFVSNVREMGNYSIRGSLGTFHPILVGLYVFCSKHLSGLSATLALVAV